MKNFNENDENFSFYIKEISIKAIITEAKDFKKSFKKAKLAYFNSLFTMKNSKLKDFKGVYVFVVKDKKGIVIKDDFFKETDIYIKINENEYKYVKSISSLLQSSKGLSTSHEEVKLCYGNVFYCGISGDIFSRTREHLTNKSYSGNMSLKLGFPSRNYVVNKLKCYIIISDDDSRPTIEKYIHSEYGSYFGDY